MSSKRKLVLYECATPGGDAVTVQGDASGSTEDATGSDDKSPPRHRRLDPFARADDALRGSVLAFCEEMIDFEPHIGAAHRAGALHTAREAFALYEAWAEQRHQPRRCTRAEFAPHFIAAAAAARAFVNELFAFRLRSAPTMSPSSRVLASNILRSAAGAGASDVNTFPPAAYEAIAALQEQLRQAQSEPPPVVTLPTDVAQLRRELERERATVRALRARLAEKEEPCCGGGKE